MASGIDLGIDGLKDYNEIGSGGFATVYSALEVDFGRLVAVKVLAAIDDAGRRRFDRERLTMGQTTGHPYIVTPFRFGYTARGNQPYLVMEYLAGGSLQDRLDAHGPFGWDEAVGLLRPIADALGYSHSAGIIHKDVKPGNILVSSAGVVKLTDFGIAAIKESTVTSQVAFSMAYTPPETFDSGRNPETGGIIDPRDERSDLYSLAATLYTLGTGVPPFQTATTAGMVNQILSEPVATTGHAGLDRFFATALAKDPAHRHPTAADWIAQLEASTPATGATTVAAPPPPAAPESGLPNEDLGPTAVPTRLVSPSPPSQPTPTEPPPTRQPRRWWRPFIGVAIAVLVLGWVVVTNWSDGGDGTDNATATSTTGPVDQPTPTSATSSQSTEPPAQELLSPSDEAPIEVVTYTGHTDNVETLVALPDGRIASGDRDNTVQVWDPADPDAPLATYTGHTDWVQALASLSDGRIASGSEDATIQVWDPGDPGNTLATYTGHNFNVQAIIELSDGTIASASNDGTVQLWDPAAPSSTLGSHSHPDLVLDIVELSDGRIASAGADGTVQLWDPDNPGTTLAAHEHTDRVLAVIELSNGMIASSGLRDGVQLWDPDNPGTTLTSYSDPLLGAVGALVQLPDGRIASTSLNRVQVWDPDDPSPILASYQGHTDDPVALVVLPDGRVASAGLDDTVQVWDPATL